MIFNRTGTVRNNFLGTVRNYGSISFPCWSYEKNIVPYRTACLGSTIPSLFCIPLLIPLCSTILSFLLHHSFLCVPPFFPSFVFPFIHFLFVPPFIRSFVFTILCSTIHYVLPFIQSCSQFVFHHPFICVPLFIHSFMVHHSFIYQCYTIYSFICLCSTIH